MRRRSSLETKAWDEAEDVEEEEEERSGAERWWWWLPAMTEI